MQECSDPIYPTRDIGRLCWSFSFCKNLVQVGWVGPWPAKSKVDFLFSEEKSTFLPSEMVFQIVLKKLHNELKV